MELFRYMTAEKYNEAKATSKLEHGVHYLAGIRLHRGVIHAFPDDPLIWGVERTSVVIEWIVANSHQNRIVLARFKVDETNSNIFVQEGDIEVWDKRPTPLPIYRRGMFETPEVIVPAPLSAEGLTQIAVPDALKITIRQRQYREVIF